MIFVGLIFAAIIGTIVVTFWKELVSWLQRALKKIQSIVNQKIEGCNAFLQRISGTFKHVSKTYSQNEFGQWLETVSTKAVSENDVPNKYKVRMSNNSQIDITDDLEMELS